MIKNDKEKLSKTEVKKAILRWFGHYSTHSKDERDEHCNLCNCLKELKIKR